LTKVKLIRVPLGLTIRIRAEVGSKENIRMLAKRSKNQRGDGDNNYFKDIDP